MNTRSRKRQQNYSPIENLPVEMLLEIFEYLDPWSIRRCSEVCITFFHLTLRPGFKKFFRLTMSDDYLAPNCGIGKLFAPERRTKRTFDRLALEKVTFKTLVFAENFFMRLGEEITEMELTHDFFTPLMREKGSEILDDIFRKNILTNFPNLKKLVLKNQDLLQLTYYPSSLKEIHISFKGDPFYIGCLNAIKNFLINEKGLGNLNKLIISNLNPFEDEYFSQAWNVTDAVKANLIEFNVIGALKYFEHDCNILEDTTIDLIHITGLNLHKLPYITFLQLHQFPNLKSLELSFEAGLDCCSDHSEAVPDFSHVQELKLHFNCVSVCETCISNIFSSFTGLIKLNLKGNLKDRQYRLIYANMPKLEYLEIHGLIPRHIFDSAEHSPNSIEQLKNLQHLLVFDTSNKRKTGLSNKCFLKFAKLPYLKTLRLSESYNGNPIQFDGIRHLVRQCPQISTFSTTDEINHETIEEIIRGWPRLTTLLLPDGRILHKNTWILIKDTCRFLKYLSVNRFQSTVFNFGFTEQCSLFKSISSLKFVKTGYAMFTRTDYHEQDVYLEKYGYRHSEVSLKRKNSATQSKSNKKCRLTYNGYTRSTFSQIEKDDSLDPYYSDEEYSDANSERPDDSENECSCCRCCCW
ncbi:uncharacterized protein LOC134827831 [Culicoides brevitarsis]|uniref:uncharacterized protein LOC134827831 n=1 Tax=Culicoides brevitarsis TaxID=469753 RepID=UPI00307C8AEF